ncbi:prepilin peptidase [Paenibacillus tritici]|uniref:prepilin peptidase n=1 Tax=Paenibacillus tritici TaxID=1873425 RepID=UPI001BA57E18|nr:A24 family peptidase [Paenibacillus tritici]QUL53383.1 prepilin peptidase [Paenibacillus tritici]
MSLSLNIILLKGLLLTLLLTYASIQDVKTRQIPDSLSVVITTLGFIHFSPLFSLSGMLLTGIPYLVAAVISKGKLGGGDIKLMAACGFVLGPVGGIIQSIIGLTFVLLAAAGIGIKSGYQSAKQTSLPLAPFLSAGGLFAFIMLQL